MPEAAHELELSAPQSRVLGCLIEKQATTPDSYPMTLKALTAASNQSSNRYPVVDYGATLVEATVHALKGKGLARIVHPARGERATKYRHVADEAIGLDPGELAIVSVLLLRGAQTLSELRTRTERMHQFATNDEIESTLAALSGRDDPVVAPVELQPGQKEHRWIQLLEVDPSSRASAQPAPGSVTARSSSPDRSAVADLSARVDDLEQRLEMLITALDDLVDLPGAPNATRKPTDDWVDGSERTGDSAV